MPKFMCITTCLLSKTGPTGKPYQSLIMAGDVISGNELPNHHFIKLDADMANMDLRDILVEKLSKYDGIFIDDNMDVQQLQGLLAQLRQEELEKDDSDIIKKVLDGHGIKYHHKLGIRRLLKLIENNDLSDELKEAKKKKVI